MRFKNRPSRSELPEINLVPMMDVLMTVLTFFIIISMTLTGQQLFNVKLPQLTSEESSEEEGEGDQQPKTLTLGIDADGKLVQQDETLSPEQVADVVQGFLREYPEGIVMLKADRQLKYENVIDVLKMLRDIGGDRVFLGIERRS